MGERVEASLKKWYNDMEAGPGLYDNYRTVGEDGTIGPSERLQEMFLKRLNGFSIQLDVVYTDEFGNVTLGDGLYKMDFDLATLQANAMTTVMPFTSDKGHVGTVRMDWKHTTWVFVPENGEPSTYVVNEFLESAMVWGVGHKLTIGLLCVIAPLADDESPKSDFLSDSSLNKFYIEGLIFADRSKLGKDGQFNPQAGVTFKHVAEVTGVSASTLSNIRNGKKSLENLTWTTLAALSFYAKIRMLDSHIIEMLRRQLTGDVPAALVESDWKLRADSAEISDADYCVVVVLRDGTSYRLDGSEETYESVMSLYEDERTAMDLKFAGMESGHTLRRVMVPKMDVKDIRLVQGQYAADSHE